jgi:hypothetical protein
VKILLSEKGQGMAEFALVLPLLALLTFGTIEVAIYLQQQSTLNAAAFLAARSASVLGNQLAPTKQSVEKFAQEAGAGWLHSAVSGMKNENSKDRSRFTLEAKTDRFSGLIDALTNGQAKGFDRLGAQATLPLEYDHKKFKQSSPTSVAKTMYMISYDSQNWAPNPNPVALAPKNVSLVQAQLRPLLNALTLKFTAPATPVKPAPTPSGAPAPKPHPNPHPKKDGGFDRSGDFNGGTESNAEAAGAPAPKPKPPAPKPPGPHPPPGPTQSVTTQFKIQIPGLDVICNFQVGEFEPFRTTGAIVPNPHHRRDQGDGGQFTSSEYLAPQYEAHGSDNQTAIARGAFRIQNMLIELEKYESELGGAAQGKGQPGGSGGSLMNACTALGLFPLDHPPIPPGLPLPPAALAAANVAWVPIARQIDAARKNAGRYADQIGNGAQITYTKLEPRERQLFKP